MFVSIIWLELIFLSPASSYLPFLYLYTCLVLVPYPSCTISLPFSGKRGPLAPLHTSTFLYLLFPLISLSVCALSFHIPAVTLCFVPFICGSHQTLAPDWFSCEQGCSRGPGTSSPGFITPSHPVHSFFGPPGPSHNTQHTHTHTTHTLCPLSATLAKHFTCHVRGKNNPYQQFAFLCY